MPDTAKKGFGRSGRAALMALITALCALAAWRAGFSPRQTMSVAVFMTTILSTLFFWQFRLAAAFLGITVLLAARLLTLDSLVKSSELPIILFLVGMMVTVGVLKGIGLFSWIIQKTLDIPRMSGPVFVAVLCLLSALMACVMDEVTSIVFMSVLVFQVCDTLKLRAAPFLMIAVLATNIGSSGTMLGNPVGILIGHKAGLTFEDFIVWAFPVMFLNLLAALALMLAWFRRDIREFSQRMDERRAMGLRLAPLVKIPFKKGLLILASVVAFIGSHHRMEKALGLETNTMLIVAPLIVAGVLMIWKRDKARHYVEHEVEWWTLLFFMMLFAVAGTLEYTDVTGRMAEIFAGFFGENRAGLTPAILAISALGSAFVDNVIFVVAFIPVVREFDSTPLWWALLFGACFGGNITMIGSTANMVALGLLEKKHQFHIKFLQWLKVGLAVGLLNCLLAWAAISVLAPFMPETRAAPEPGLHEPGARQEP